MGPTNGQNLLGYRTPARVPQQRIEETESRLNTLQEMSRKRYGKQINGVLVKYHFFDRPNAIAIQVADERDGLFKLFLEFGAKQFLCKFKLAKLPQ